MQNWRRCEASRGTVAFRVLIVVERVICTTMKISLLYWHGEYAFSMHFYLLCSLVQSSSFCIIMFLRFV